jgi:hypothetical protein
MQLSAAVAYRVHLAVQDLGGDNVDYVSDDDSNDGYDDGGRGNPSMGIEMATGDDENAYDDYNDMLAQHMQDHEHYGDDDDGELDRTVQTLYSISVQMQPQYSCCTCIGLKMLKHNDSTPLAAADDAGQAQRYLACVSVADLDCWVCGRGGTEMSDAGPWRERRVSSWKPEELFEWVGTVASIPLRQRKMIQQAIWNGVIFDGCE